jgi:dynein heavy chain
MKKRDFYKYDTGREQALQSLSGVQNEIQDYNNQRAELLFQAQKFEQASLIDNIEGQITTVETEVSSMQILWDHINNCQGIFQGYMDLQWLKTDSNEMEEEVKKLLKTLKEMKVDKRCNAYTGILEEIKKWLVFLPLVGQLRDPSMRDRHWDMIRQKAKSDFVINDKLVLKMIYDLNLGAIADDVEEITD